MFSDEALGDDRDALGDLAAELGYCACHLPGGGFIAQGRDSWAGFLVDASADRLAQARAELARIKAAARASGIVGNSASEQGGDDDSGFPGDLGRRRR